MRCHGTSLCRHELRVAARAQVDGSALIGSNLLPDKPYIAEMNIVDLSPYVTAHEASVLAVGDDVIEIYAAHLSAASYRLALRETPVGILVVAVGARLAGNMYWLCLSPPHVAP